MANKKVLISIPEEIHEAWSAEAKRLGQSFSFYLLNHPPHGMGFLLEPVTAREKLLQLSALRSKAVDDVVKTARWGQDHYQKLRDPIAYLDAIDFAIDRAKRIEATEATTQTKGNE